MINKTTPTVIKNQENQDFYNSNQEIALSIPKKQNFTVKISASTDSDETHFSS